MCLKARTCFCLIVSQIMICQLCVTSNVQLGSVYKYFTSASTFFHSNCDIMNQANYDVLLPLLDLLLCLKFSSHYDSHDLLHLIYC